MIHVEPEQAGFAKFGLTQKPPEKPRPASGTIDLPTE
jgi:hypothetical protein